VQYWNITTKKWYYHCCQQNFYCLICLMLFCNQKSIFGWPDPVWSAFECINMLASVVKVSSLLVEVVLSIYKEHYFCAQDGDWRWATRENCCIYIPAYVLPLSWHGVSWNHLCRLWSQSWTPGSGSVPP